MKAKSEIAIVKDAVKALDFGVASIISYRTHAYRQWGTIANEVLDDVRVGNAIFRVVAANKAIEERKAEIAKAQGKDIFQLIELLGYQVDDLADACQRLGIAIGNSAICSKYKKHECVSGSKDGKRLGLIQLQRKTMQTINGLDQTMAELKMVAKQAYNQYQDKLWW